MKFFLFCLSGVIVTLLANAQTDPQTLEFLDKKAETVSEDLSEDDDLSGLFDVFDHLLEHPLNINRTTADELRETTLFTETEIAAIIRHRERYGPLLAIEELQVCDPFTGERIREFQPFITTGRDINTPNAGIGRMLREGRQSLVFRFQLTPEKKRGFRDEGEGAKYEGDPAGLMMRYRFSYMNKLSMALAADKDPGESFFKGTNKSGFDFYSGHFALRDVGLLKIITLGDYRLNYGQGLTLGSYASGGKGYDPAGIIRTFGGIRPYSGSAESGFQRGIAFALCRKRWQADLFLSGKKNDAGLSGNSDSTDNEVYFTSLQSSGLHRTESEISNRRTVREILYGVHIGYHRRNFRAGITALKSDFSKTWNKDLQPYNQFDFSGSSFHALGIDYLWTFRNITFFGETTRNISGAPATLNGMVISVDPRAELSIFYRNYPSGFKVLYSAAFREGSKNSNERGFYAALLIKPTRTINISACFDQFYFPWLRYRTDAPGGGTEYAVTITKRFTRKTELSFRFRTTIKTQNSSDENLLYSYTVPVTLRNYRLHLTAAVSKSFTLRTRIEMSTYKKDGILSEGFMIYQDLLYHPMMSRLKGNIRFALFYTDSYDSRIYAYENEVLYGYSISPYYYKGSRFYINLRYKVVKGLDLWLRYALTSYWDREVIGSGWDEISGNKKSDIKAQLRYEF